MNIVPQIAAPIPKESKYRWCVEGTSLMLCGRTHASKQTPNDPKKIARILCFCLRFSFSLLLPSIPFSSSTSFVFCSLPVSWFSMSPSTSPDFGCRVESKNPGGCLFCCFHVLAATLAPKNARPGAQQLRATNQMGLEMTTLEIHLCRALKHKKCQKCVVNHLRCDYDGKILSENIG